MKILKSRLTYNSRVYNNEVFDKFLFCDERFNKEGKLLELTEFDEDGSIVLNEKRKFNEGNLVKVITTNNIFNTEQFTEYVYIDNLLVEEIEHFSNLKYIKSKIVYDYQTRVISIQKEDENNSFYGKMNIEYSQNGRIKKEYDEEGKIVIKEEWMFDEKGRDHEVLSTQYYYDNGELSIKEITRGRYLYSNDNLIKEEYDRNGTVYYSKVFVFDSADNMIEYRLMDNEVSHAEVSTYKYNSEGLEVLAIQSYDEQEVYSREIKYDGYYLIKEIIEKHLEQDNYVSAFKQEFTNEYW